MVWQQCYGLETACYRSETFTINRYLPILVAYSMIIKNLKSIMRHHSHPHKPNDEQTIADVYAEKRLKENGELDG